MLIIQIIQLVNNAQYYAAVVVAVFATLLLYTPRYWLWLASVGPWP